MAYEYPAVKTINCTTLYCPDCKAYHCKRARNEKGRFFIYCAECGKRTGNFSHMHNAYTEWRRITSPEPIDISKGFKPGRKYEIRNISNKKDPALDYPMPDNKVFVYIRKDGRHHIFRHMPGGWTRTYTDAQLIGKLVSEVKE